MWWESGEVDLQVVFRCRIHADVGLCYLVGRCDRYVDGRRGGHVAAPKYVGVIVVYPTTQ